ncbi:MAG: alpha-glucan family phosphorylase [Acidobacteria bacterium]|nr:alpha-glucan family phosphorylase [Acidobacteriota bacterium]
MSRDKDLPPLPARIRRLADLAANLWWSWHDAPRKVFRDLDYQLWRATAHNPVHMLWLVSPERLEQVARDPEFLRTYDAAVAGLDAACEAKTGWMARRVPDGQNETIAYFSAEFAIHQSLPIYAGGLGVLAGDHCKQASDLGVPLVGVGFMYPQGYFHQTVSEDGWQLEVYEKLNWPDVAIQQALKPDGQPCIIAVPLGDRAVLTNVWKVSVGRINIYLLDTSLEENAPQDRDLSARLYGGDRETRLQQEIILGIGGVRALRALGIAPSVWHLNEGHAAFVVLQRIHEFIAKGTSFDRALEQIRRNTIFTTHTPVAAGHDAFPFDRVEHHLQGAWGPLADYRARFLALGEHDGQFNMTVLALRTSGRANGVSQLHGNVTRGMWEPLLAERHSSGQHPLTSITNGVHVATWLALELAQLFERHLGPDWRDRCDEPDFWNGVLAIPDEELWQARAALKRFLFTFIRQRARDRWALDNVSAAAIVAAGPLLDPGALTIGFARRFAAYKRPELIFKDPARLIRILSAPRRHVQIVFAGKSHPADDAGKRHLQQIYQRAVDPAYGGRIAFVDDYDLHVAHFLTQGCDVWLNTPRKPLEASGTSGMKAGINGVPHLSIGDGWWAEAYNGSNGWRIDGGTRGDDTDAQDAADADALYRLLEEQIVPTYYQRGQSGVPHAWLRIVKECIRTVTPQFSAARMVKQYVEEMYGPAAAQAKDSSAPQVHR